MPKKFSKNTLDALLERVIDEYFAEDNNVSLWEVIEYVKGLYKEEIDSLDD